jgi:hypothetical protein
MGRATKAGKRGDRGIDDTGEGRGNIDCVMVVCKSLPHPPALSPPLTR